MNMTFSELRLLVYSPFPLPFQFQHVIYYCQIQLRLAEHFIVAKQHEQEKMYVSIHIHMTTVDSFGL